MDFVEIHLMQFINGFLRGQRLFQPKTNHFPWEVAADVVHGHTHVGIEISKTIHGACSGRVVLVKVPILFAGSH